MNIAKLPSTNTNTTLVERVNKESSVIFSDDDDDQCIEEQQIYPFDQTTGIVTAAAKLPSVEESVGVDNAFLQLCATISSIVYTADSKQNFKAALEAIIPKETLTNDFPDLEVQFFQQGIKVFGAERSIFSRNPPYFTMVTTGDTLILGWRGTASIRDIITDTKIGSRSLGDGPENSLVGLEAQAAHYKMITQDYFKNHHNDIRKMVDGTFKKPNGKGLSGGPIKRIYLTGHSLGGGLAQVAHLCLTAPDGPYPELAKLLEKKKTIIKTMVLSAPMTTVVKPDASDEVAQFIQEKIEPHMCNIFYSSDVVPRGYSDIRFINNFVDALLEDTTSVGGEGRLYGITRKVIRRFADRLNNDHATARQAQTYRHVGKLIHYAETGAEPVTYFDPGFFSDNGRSTSSGFTLPSFRDLEYSGPLTGVIGHARANHRALVVSTGLMFS